MRSKAIFMALLAFAFGAQAVPVSPEQARSIAQMWAARGKRLGVRMGTEVEDVAEYAPTRGGRFFAVRMKGGTVFTSGDTRMNPVLAFTRERIQKLDPNSPLYKLLSAASQAGDDATAPRKWAALQAKADRISSSKVPIESEEEIDDVRVSPFLATKWGQSTVIGADGAETDCFNFYTPPTQTVIKEELSGGYAETNESVNCVCGCVATAMAQLMRYWCWPQGEVAAFENADCSAPTDTSVLKGVFWGPGDFQCLTADQNPIASTNLTTVAGAYDWANMIEIPDGAAVEDNCKAIGKLTYDCGVAVGMDYNIAEMGGSGIYTSEAGNIGNALKDRFGYTSALLCTASGLTMRDAVRQKVIFANLDAKCPVLLLITGNGGHAVVGDGYGFDSESGENLPYVHLNMGWQGQCDVWYNLPYVNTAANPERFSGFDTINGVVYNVFTNTTGWIISGRVLDTAGQPVSGAKVTLRDASNAVVDETTAESSGVYAFFVPGGECQYDVFAENADGSKMADRLVEIKGGSMDGSNSWGNDLTLRDPTVRVKGTDGEQLFASLDSALRVATNAGDRVEILHTTSLRRDSFVGNDLTLTAVQATPSKINRQNGATISITNGVASLANLAFKLEATTPVLVGVDGKVSVAGRVELDDIASMTPGIELEGTNSFVLAGELVNGLTIGCPADEAGAVFGTYSCDPAVAEISAKRIVTVNPDLVGLAAEDGTLVWQAADEVDPLVAVCYQDAEPARHYRTLDKLIVNLGKGEVADIVVSRNGCRMTKTLTVAGAASIRGETDGLSVAVTGNDDTPQFTIGADASLMVSNLTFKGYTGKSLFRVESGGALTLEDGAVIDGAVGTAERTSGAIVVAKGTATLRSGAKIVNCRAGGASACGGAIWVSNNGCTLNLEGGEITGCWAKSAGGGVYVYSGSSVNVSGDVNIHDNTSGDPVTKIDDLYLMSSKSKLILTGLVTGRIGVRYGDDGSGNAEGAGFLTLGEGVSVEDAAASLPAFFNDTDDGLAAALSEDGAQFVWAVPPPETGEVTPEDAWDWVIYNDGTPQAVTNYYGSFEFAYASLTNDATIVMLGAELLLGDVTVTRKVLIRTNDPAGSAGLYRANECKFTVDAGGSLTLEGIVMSGIFQEYPYSDPYGGTEELLYVKEGGSLTLGDGAFVCDVWGDGGRARGGVVVWGGEFRMLPGAIIYACGNNYPLNETVAVAPANVGVGGGLLVDSGTAYLEGGLVTSCWAERAAGVYFGNKSTVYVSGDVAITNNFTNGGVPSNLTVEDKSELLVTNAFSAASIGVADGIQCNTNVFGRIPASALPDGFASATNYLSAAACFHRDNDESVIGQVVANDTEALLVWPWAVKDGVYVDEDGTEYQLVSTQPLVAIPKGLALTYSGEEQVGVAEGTGYTLTGNRATDAGDYTATAKLTDGYRWSDGSFTDKAIHWSIAKAAYDMSGVVFTNVTYVCDGAAKSNLVDEATLPEGVSVTNYLNNGQTEVGTYMVTAQFGGDADNFEPIDDMTATLTITEAPTPPPGPTPGKWETVTNHPTPIAFKSIERVSDTEWALVVTDRVEYCNYRLIWTKDLTKGFTETGKWEHAVGPAAEPVWTTNVITTGGAWFWRAEGADGTNMVPPQVEN